MHTLLQIRELMSPYKKGPQVHSLLQRELNGGITTREQIDAIADLPAVTMLKISGLTNATLDYLVTRYPDRFVALELWKCPQVSDLSPIEGLQSLRHLLMFHNRKASRLWDFRRTPELIGLDFTDFPKLNDLTDLAQAQSLRELGFGNMIWNKASYLSLEPLSALTTLEALIFNAVAITDGRIQPLAALQGLADLRFPSNLFTRGQLAWLRARLPSTVCCEALESHQSRVAIAGKSGRLNDAKVNGRGERALDSRKDAALLATKAQEFAKMVEQFRADPLAGPPEP